MIRIEGSFFNGGDSSRQAASLSIGADSQVEVSLLDGGGADVPACCFSDLDISPRLGNTPRYINFSSGASFETLDNDRVDRLLLKYQHSAAYRFIHLLESRLIFVLLVVVLVSGFFYGAVKYGVPAMANSVAKILPAEASQYLGQGALETMDELFFSPSELPLERQQSLRKLFSSYAEKYSDYRISFEFRKGGAIGANAFALPDGVIVFTDEMVALAEHDDELLAIMGHEIGHVVHRHILRRVIQDSTLTILVVMVTGDISSASSIVVVIPTLLLELSYSREFETEADDFALEFLVQQGLPPESFAHIMTRLVQSHEKERLDAEKMTTQENLSEGEGQTKPKTDQSEDDDGLFTQMTPYLSSHPTTEQRIQKFLSGGKGSKDK